MNKPLCVVSCPCDTFSGYGRHSVVFLEALIALKGFEWDIKILSMRWGDTPFGYLVKHGKQDLIKRIIPVLEKQPDYWFQITVPNEMQKIGKLYSVLVTAGVETTIASPTFIEGCNKADLILVPSQHTKQVLENSKFEKRENPSNKVIGLIECTSPIEVLFEGCDLNIFKKLDENYFKEINSSNLIKSLDSVKEEFCFLFVGHWLQGDLGEDRKDVGMLVKTFLETFRDKNPMKKMKKPALILKTSGANTSIMDRENILSKIQIIRNQVQGELPNIYLLHGQLLDQEINELYNHPKVKAFVSFTKGEGFGLPLLEASIAQKPVIVSGWSGHTDFLSPEFSIFLKGEIKQIHPSAVVENMLIPESGWFTVDYNIASKCIEDIYVNYKNYIDIGKRQSYRSRTNFSLEKMKELLGVIIENKFPKQKPIVLPTIKKLELPKIIKREEEIKVQDFTQIPKNKFVEK